MLQIGGNILVQEQEERRNYVYNDHDADFVLNLVILYKFV